MWLKLLFWIFRWIIKILDEASSKYIIQLLKTEKIVPVSTHTFQAHLNGMPHTGKFRNFKQIHIYVFLFDLQVLF